MGINEIAAAGFGAAADTYERGRPSYPDGVIELFRDQLGVGPASTVVDLGAGTGKLTRLLVATGATVVAVEPVEAMRAQLVALLPEVEAVDGTAESIPLPDGSCGAVTVAQAFHWFEPAPALEEIARVLEPGGGLGLVWNERDESVPWVAELSGLLNWGVQRPYRRDQDWSAVVAASDRFTPLQHRQLSYQQELDAETLVERALSTSYIAARPAAENVRLAEDIRALVAGFPPRFELPYLTDVHWCHRR